MLWESLLLPTLKYAQILTMHPEMWKEHLVGEIDGLPGNYFSTEHTHTHTQGTQSTILHCIQFLTSSLPMNDYMWLQ